MTDNEEEAKNLRKLIKYEESLGVDVHQKDYFDNLYRKTTASYRAKVDATADSGLKSTRSDAVVSAVTSGNRRTRIDKENVYSRRNEQMEKKTLTREVDPGLRSRVKDGVLKENTKQQQKSLPSAAAAGHSNAKRETAAASGAHTARSSRATEKSTNIMWIRPRSKTPHSSGSSQHHRDMDPVQLYQYYSNEWRRFKTNLPGENSRSELRWQIRHKLLGE